jgi:hypothetical protein
MLVKEKFRLYQVTKFPRFVSLSKCKDCLRPRSSLRGTNIFSRVLKGFPADLLHCTDFHLVAPPLGTDRYSAVPAYSQILQRPLSGSSCNCLQTLTYFQPFWSLHQHANVTCSWSYVLRITPACRHAVRTLSSLQNEEPGVKSLRIPEESGLSC